MKKLLFCATLLTAQSVVAQSVDSYIFKVESGKAYTPLTTGTNITAGLVWDEENFKIPLGFTADVGGKATSYFSIGTTGIFAIASDTENVVNTFIPYGADLTDRTLSSTPESPIRYTVSGTSPARIFKVEFSNAGFYSEIVDSGTNNDFVNFQVWLYETSNIVEFRYGASNITYPENYFEGAAPIIGYIKNFDLTTYTIEKLYALKGVSTAPTVDSTTTILTIPGPLSDHPASGTVYRFVPKSVAASIGEVDITADFTVYPTIVSDRLNIECQGNNNATARVLNISGQQMSLPVQLVHGKNQIASGSLSTGQYLLEIATPEGKAVYRFMKQ